MKRDSDENCSFKGNMLLVLLEVVGSLAGVPGPQKLKKKREGEMHKRSDDPHRSLG